jgi:hypothetical protein
MSDEEKTECEPIKTPILVPSFKQKVYLLDVLRRHHANWMRSPYSVDALLAIEKIAAHELGLNRRDLEDTNFWKV